jgi:DNA repair photolyase
MIVKELKVDSVIKKITRKDNLFKGDYTTDPYQNCDFGCIYCDSSYDKTIYVKINAAETLEKELKKLPKGRIIVGSVHDPYQNSEKKYMLTRKILEVIKKNDFTCHVLTKSDLVLRDIDILKKIDKCFVTVSITSLKDKNSNFFEKNVSNPKKRFKVIEELNKNSIYSGIAVMPFLPFIAESEIKQFFQEAKNYNIKYILYKHLELKGDQKKIFFEEIKNFYPDILEKYEKLYSNCYHPNQEYIKKIDDIMKKNSKKYNIKIKI